MFQPCKNVEVYNKLSGNFISKGGHVFEILMNIGSAEYVHWNTQSEKPY